MSSEGGDRRALPAGVRGAPPPPGRVLAVVATSEECGSCTRILERLDRLDAVSTEIIEVGDAEAVARLGIDRVPQTWLVSTTGDVIRHWVGEPLAGTLESTVEEAVGQET